jgi:YesN/AraC family two-component response regulator
LKVVQFTIPVAKENTVVVQEDILPYFYQHLHRHTEIQISWIVKGKGTLIAGNYMQPFQDGDIYIFASNQPHLLKSDSAYFKQKSGKQIHSISIYFNPSGILEPVFNLPETREIKKFLQQAEFGLQIPEHAKNNIITEIQTIKNAKHGFKFASLIKLLQECANIKDCKKLTTVVTENKFSEEEGLRMNDIYQFTMKRYSENIALKDLAALACLTPQSFCRYFKKHTQKTYVDFLNEIRISQACKKIIEGNYDSIATLALKTGFNNAVSFNRVFKKTIGKAPLQYRKDYMEKLDLK